MNNVPPKYGMPSPEPLEIIWNLFKLSLIVLVPVLLIIGLIIYFKKKNKKKK